MNSLEMNDELDKLIRTKPIPRLSYKNTPVIIYGAGQMGEASSVYLKKAGVKIECFIDKNPNIIGKLVNDIPVINPDNLTPQQKTDCLFAISVLKVPYNSISHYLKNIGCQKICYIGHLIDQTYGKPSIANVWYFDNITEFEIENLKQNFNQFADTISQKAMLQFLNWIILGIEKDYLQETINPEEKYFIPEVRRILKENEVFVDCGAYNGNSIAKIQKITNNKFNAIYCFEPEPENYKLLLEFISQNPNKNKIISYPFGLGLDDNERNFTVGLGLTSRYTDAVPGQLITMHRLDTTMNNIPYSFIKIYALGIGWEVIQGGLETLKKYRPIITINIHHTRADFVKIPFILMQNLNNYKFLLRLHGYCGSEAVLYGIPLEREEN